MRLFQNFRKLLFSIALLSINLKLDAMPVPAAGPSGGPPGGAPPVGSPPAGGTPCWTPPCIPIDGFSGVLLLSGALYGVAKVYNRKQSKT